MPNEAYEDCRTAWSRRMMLVGAITSAFTPGWARGRSAPQRYDAVVGKGRSGPPAPRFRSLQAAIDAAPANDAPYRIWLGAGRFEGQSVIARAGVELWGRGPARTILSCATAAGLIAANGKPYGTFRTACLSVTAPDLRLDGLTIENAFDAPAEMRRPGGMRSDDGGSQQAIALSLGRGADRSIVSNCHFASHQDTLYCAEGRALFVGCRISGSYDFIFGGAAARFEGCEIVSRPRFDPVEGYIAAPSTMIDRPAGLVFDRCRLTAEPGVPRGSVFLGRPWRLSTTVDGKRVGDLRSVGMAAYLGCVMGPHIAPSGWTRMWYTGPDGNPRTWFEPEQARFQEFGNIGPGARGQRRGRMLDAIEAARLSRAALFGGWRPAI